MFFFLVIRLPPISTRTDTLFPYTTLFRSLSGNGAITTDSNNPKALSRHHGPALEHARWRDRLAHGAHLDLHDVGGRDRARLPRHIPLLVCHYRFDRRLWRRWARDGCRSADNRFLCLSGSYRR